MMTDIISSILIFVAVTISMGYVLPQLLLNYRRKSTEGLNDTTILGNLALTIAGLLFVYGVSMPLLYKIMSPISVMAAICLAIQRIWYGQAGAGFLPMVIGLIVGAICMVPLVLRFPEAVGFSAGWLCFAVQAVYYIPQIAQIIKTKSMVGLSMTMLSVQAFGFFCELIAALLLQLPMPVIANDIRAIGMYGIFLICFLNYRSDKNSLI